MGTTTVSASIGILQSNNVVVTVTDVKVLQLATNALAYDSTSGKIFVSLPGPQGQVAVIDPVTGSIVQSVQVGNEPNRLTVSSDGQFLYVSIDNENTVKRLSLPTLATDLTFSLSSPVSSPGDYLCGKDMKVVPGNARTVVIATARHLIDAGSCAFNQPDETAVFQDGTKLPNTWSGVPVVHRLEFSDSPSLLFGLGTFSPGSLARFSVTASGLSLIDFSYLLANYPGRDLKFFNGLIYTASGDVYNGYTRVGSFTNTGVLNIRPDPARNRLFAVTPGVSDSVATIQAFDPASLTLLGSLDIPNLSIPAVPQYPRFTDLVRWGTDGLAFRTSSNEVVILRSPLVGS
jgi:DNA-binding beta-propeller fold protein YncE